MPLFSCQVRQNQFVWLSRQTLRVGKKDDEKVRTAHGWEALFTAIRTICGSEWMLLSNHHILRLPTLQMLTSFLSLVLDVILICAWPQSDSRGRNLHRGDKGKQFACIYLSPRG